MYLRDIVKKALEQGRRVERTGKNRLKFLSPDPQVAPVFYSETAHDWRALRNLVAMLRRAGVEI